MIRRIVVRVATAGLLFFFIAARAFSQPAGQAVMPPAASNDAATSQSGGGSAKEAESSPQSLPFPALQGILDDYASLRAGSGYEAAPEGGRRGLRDRSRRRAGRAGRRIRHGLRPDRQPDRQALLLPRSDHLEGGAAPPRQQRLRRSERKVLQCREPPAHWREAGP